MEQTAVSQRAKVKERIIYVDPNDVYDYDANNQHQGESLTPKYEDFCISFNLIIECYNRLSKERMITAPDVNKRTDENGVPQTYKITWGLTQEDLRKKRSSVLQGNRGKDNMNNEDGTFNYSDSGYNYLTTYFTDISYNSYKNTEIEGLGVESVQISYESWYTPTVVIKFVDVRGSALWGREEEVHVDENLMAENIFGAFFTMPYPLFRLQVKGFLGKPVTYQLTCSNFKGEFNAQTGNFEAVATFIGYSWSLMTDIPFTYLVAAPYSKYIGRDYWNKHVNSKEWGLWNDGDTLLPPPTLYNLFKNIKAAFDEDVSKGTPEQQQELTSMSQERKILSNIKSHIDSFVKTLGKQVDDNYFKVYDENEKKEQVLLFSNSDKLNEVSADVNNSYKKLCESIKQYEVGGFNSVDITASKYPNTWTESEEIPKFNFVETFNVNTDNINDEITNISLTNQNDITIDNLLNLTLNEKEEVSKMTHEMSKTLLEAIRERNTKIKNYCYLIDFSNVYELCRDRTADMDKRENAIREEIQEYVNINVINLLGGTRENGFKPFIGNVFKIIFCHLETFCHIMFDSAKEIYEEIKDGNRKPSRLGVTISNNNDDGEFTKYSVDIVENDTENIHPWPAIYDVPNNTEGGYTSELANVYGWPGDLTKDKHKFKEVQVVYGLQEGIQFLVEEKPLDEISNNSNLADFPTMPFDYYLSNGNVFKDANIKNIADLAGYLGFRISAIFGVVSNDRISQDLSKTLGRMDAYNLYAKYSSMSEFTRITQGIGADALKDIMLCKDNSDYNAYGTYSNGIYRFDFETAKEIRNDFNNKRRHPFFKDDSTDFFEYIHFYDNKGVRYVPTSLKDFKNYQASKANDNEVSVDANFLFDVRNTNDVKFIPNCKDDGKILESNDWIYIADSGYIDVLNGKGNRYVNNYMFNIITDESSINAIKHKYYELKNGGLKVGEHEVKDNLTEFFSQFMKLGSDYISKYFNGIKLILSGNIDKLQIDKGGLLGQNMTIFNYDDWYAIRDDNKPNNVEVNSNGELLLNNDKVNFSELVIQQFKIYYAYENDNKFFPEYNLFGCPFYYQQNQIKNTDVKQKVKALLFLHTFRYDFNEVKLNVFSPNKTNGATEEVPKAYLLLLGGLLWRKRLGSDPIIFTGYKTCDINHALYNGRCFTILNNTSNLRYDLNVSKLIGNNDIDWNIENQLIHLFENFAKTEFKDISNKYELKQRIGTRITEFNRETFNKTFKQYYDIVNEEAENDEEKETFNIEKINKTKEFIDRNLSNFIGNYSCMCVSSNGNDIAGDYPVRLLLNENDRFFQDKIKNLYVKSYIITDSCYRRQNKNGNNNGVIKIKKALMDSYLNGFVDACRDIVSYETVDIGEGDSITVTKDAIKNRDLSLAIYYYLKNLWDKWLVVSNTNAFDVKPFFFDNFIFTDSFYNNVYHRLAVNCESLLDTWTELADNGSLFHFLSRICTDSGCIFLPVPDYVGFNGETQKHDIEMMENLFRPMPYDKIPAPVDNNKFIVMFTHSPSHIKDSQGGFPTDSYDIWSHKLNDISKTARDLFKFQSTNSRNFDRDMGQATREGYNVPSFGVSFAKQNNHIFRNLKISMDNPVVTEQSIRAQWNIAKKAANSEHTIMFIGQDTFNVFTNYSYSINLEMIGNAQICPLMYFQLMNVPMWRGTYMIYKVVHNMTPGNMITTVTAMKMNKYAQPFNSHFFVVHNIKKRDKEEDCDDRIGTNSDDSTYSETYSISSDDVVGLVGDSYAVGMTISGFVEKAQAKGITAKAYANQKAIGNISNNDTTYFSKGGANTGDINGIRNALNQKCNVIIIHLGLNGHSRGSTVQKDLEKGVDYAKQHGAKKVFLCIPTCPAKQSFNINDRDYYNQIVSGIRGAAESSGCGIIDYSKKLQKTIYDETKKYDREDLHPSRNGYKLIIDEVLRLLVSESGDTDVLKPQTVTSQSKKKKKSGSPKVDKLKKIVGNVKRAYSYKHNEWYTLKKEKSYTDSGKPVVGETTSGPKTWYGRAGIDLKGWIDDFVTYEMIKAYFTRIGFTLIYHGGYNQTKELEKTDIVNKLQEGDLCTLFIAKTGDAGRKMSHGAMWTGTQWRSSFIQDSIWPYGKGYHGSEGDYCVCIWRYNEFMNIKDKH